MLRNSGTGDLTVTPPSGTIDGGSTLTMAVNESAFIITDGTNYFTIGFGQPSSSNFDFVSIAVPGSGDLTLTGVQLNRISYQFTGILTGDRKIIVPNTIQEYWVDNSTTGSFTLSIATALQVTPTTVNQQDRAILYCDSNDVVNATTDTSVTFPVQITQGGTSATTAAVALANLGGVPTSRQILAGTGIGAGLGDLTADRTVNLDVASNLNIDHSAVSLLAGTGISATGLGDITLSRTINLDAASNLNTDHSAVVLSAGTGISSSGLGDITASRTINADISNTVQLGVVERATQAEVDAGGDISRYITPNTFDLSQQLLDVANQVVVTTGTFFPGFTGFSVDPTVELRWTKYGPTVAFAYSIAILNGISGNGFGTSNANVFSWTGIASEVSPSSVATGSTQNILGQDNTTFNHASIGILNTVPDFNFLKLTGVQYGLNNWTAAGTKGYSNNSFLLYAFQP